MKKALLSASLFFFVAMSAVIAQPLFDEEITVPPGYAPTVLVMPPSPLTTQILFIGTVDSVQTTATYGNPAGTYPAKEWHDFIGFTPDPDSDDLGWVSVNHEMILSDDHIGDGGGMTVFKIRRVSDDSLEIVEQTLADGRAGKFFNVDFVNTVGETGMNCGGLIGPDGRIWTAEEWFIGSNDDFVFRDTTDRVIPADISGWGTDVTVPAYQTLNWMVEIDPREAKAIRKQYNWGRQGFEGGAFSPDQQTIVLGWDGSPCFLTKFVADVVGDYTQGTMYVYKQDADPKWIEIPNTAENMLEFEDACISVGATMYNRIEWVTYDDQTGKFYMAETGNDGIGNAWDDEFADGATLAPHHQNRAFSQGLTSAADPAYTDYYGRVLTYDPELDIVEVYLEGGPAWPNSVGPEESQYFDKHLSNPDGLNVMTIGEKNYLLVQEDLNGTSYGRVPKDVTSRTCEIFLLDLAIENPLPSDLIRLSVVPVGAEVTGAIPTPDMKTVLVNSQHPSSSNPFPYNHSLTVAIHGFEGIVSSLKPTFDESDRFQAYPNPATRWVQFNKTVDLAIYDAMGKRIRVHRNVNEIEVYDLTPGMYFLQTGDREIFKLVIE